MMKGKSTIKWIRCNSDLLATIGLHIDARRRALDRHAFFSRYAFREYWKPPDYYSERQTLFRTKTKCKTERKFIINKR